MTRGYFINPSIIKSFFLKGAANVRIAGKRNTYEIDFHEVFYDHNSFHNDGFPQYGQEILLNTLKNMWFHAKSQLALKLKRKSQIGER